MPENKLTLRDALLSGYTVSDISVTECVVDAGSIVVDISNIVVTIEVSRPVNRFKMTLRVPDDKENPDAEG